jgi:hypothetical protein
MTSRTSSATIPIPIRDDPVDFDDTSFDPHPRDHDPRKAPVEKTESMIAVELRRRHDGWTAERQRIFLNTLANTGSVADAAEMADITPRSAYRLRNHPKGEQFARAWDAALICASKRLFAVAMERAVTGTPRTVWREGRIIAQTAVPSDRMLMFLLRSLDPGLFDPTGNPITRSNDIMWQHRDFAPAMAALVDTDVDADLLDVDDYRPKPPRDEQA